MAEKGKKERHFQNLAYFRFCPGSLGRALVSMRKRANQPPLLSILLANVQSLDNKLDKLWSRMDFQYDKKNCNDFFTESGLDPLTWTCPAGSPFTARTGQHNRRRARGREVSALWSTKSALTRYSFCYFPHVSSQYGQRETNYNTPQWRSAPLQFPAEDRLTSESEDKSTF